MQSKHLCGLTLILALIVGCERGAPPGAKPPAATSGPASPAGEVIAPTTLGDASEIDKLRSIPYLGSATIEEGEEESGVVLHDRARSWPGYNMYTMRELCRSELMDMDGNRINSWHMPDNRYWERSILVENGDVLVVGSANSPDPRPSIADDARYVLRYDWSGQVRWQKFMRTHHDIEVSPRGDLLVLGFERRLISDVHPWIRSREDHIFRLSQDGELLEKKSVYEVLSSRRDMFKIRGIAPNNLGVVPWVDLFHLNSVEQMNHPELFGTDPLYDPEHVLVCSRHQDTVFIFHWKTGQLIWAWGRGELSGPHDAQLLANGNITIFDNGLERGWSRVIEVDPRSNRIVWEYKAPVPEDFFTRGAGSVQRLPNGNSLISESEKGHAFEVTPDGEIVWAFRCPHENNRGERATFVRMIRYPAEMVEKILAEHPQP